MILVDAIYVNKGGGKILLDYFIEELEKTGLTVFYLLDERVRGDHPAIDANNEVLYMNSSLKAKTKFYLGIRKKVDTVFCFGNFPPPVKMPVKVFTYFHQLLFVEPVKDHGFKNRLMISLKVTILRWCVSNCDYWMVQSERVKKGLVKKFAGIKDKSVLITPFYPSVIIPPQADRKADRFVYVSTAPVHKNHDRLLDAFVLFYDQHRLGELHLTVGPEFVKLHERIMVLQVQGYPLVDHGFITREQLALVYGSAAFVIYPSLAESFGLGIVEAIESGCKVIGPDLPWLYAVCEPSGVFDPLSVHSISDAMGKAVMEELPFSKQLVFNEINCIIDLLKENEQK